jgi:hypothetical protein
MMREWWWAELFVDIHPPKKLPLICEIIGHEKLT